MGIIQPGAMINDVGEVRSMSLLCITIILVYHSVILTLCYCTALFHTEIMKLCEVEQNLT